MRLRQLCWGMLFVLAVAGSAIAQPEPPNSDAPEGSQRIVTIRGCLDGTFLTATDVSEQPVHSAFSTTAGDRFQIVGDRELLEELQEHAGHEVNIIGALLDETGMTQRAGVERRIGDRTRVWIGGGSRRPVPEDPCPRTLQAELPELEMRAVIHVSARCSA